MIINQTCNDLSTVFTFLVLLGIGIVVIFWILRNVLKFQKDIRAYGSTHRSEYYDDMSVGDDGELVEVKQRDKDDVRKKKKRDNAPSVFGCFSQQLIIAVLGLITALISAFAATNPIVLVTFHSLCSNIVNIGPTAEATKISPTPSATNTFAITSTPSLTPIATSSPPTPFSSIVFHPLDLTESLNAWSSYLGLTRGDVMFEDIPFRIGNELNTYGCRPEISSTTVIVEAEISYPLQVYFLVNAGNGFASQSDRRIGQFDFYVGDTTYSYFLVLGQNIRDWATTPSSVVTQITSLEVQEVWTGRAYDGRTGRIDLVSIVLPEILTHQTLHEISVIDSTIGSLSSGTDPCIQVQAITVASRG